MQFQSTIQGIPCIIKVTHYEPYRPPDISGPPETSTPAEGGYLEFDVLDRRGRHAPWLEHKARKTDYDRIYDEAVFLASKKEEYEP